MCVCVGRPAGERNEQLVRNAKTFIQQGSPCSLKCDTPKCLTGMWPECSSHSRFGILEKTGHLNKCFSFSIEGFNLLFIVFAGVLQTITTPYFCTLANLEILKPSSNFKDLYQFSVEKDVLFPTLSSDVLRNQQLFLYLFLQPSSEAAGCVRIPELLVLADGRRVLNNDSEIAFFPVLISRLAFPSRLEESLVCPGEQDLGSSW